MKKTWLTAKELATLLQVSIKTVRRAYRNGEIPMVRFRHMVRFNLAKVQRSMERDGRSRLRRLNSNSGITGAIAGDSRRRAPKSPRTVKRGLV
ncbi:MAG: helix-turn-helix domain-containing protein [Nitrospiraceae bacterium]|nr:helix-turn-helix domain-containing protein [Nitrospiraceae bacterium]